MRKVACIGVGNIGRAWAICFARGGVETILYDEKPGAAENAVSLIENSVEDLFENESIKDVAEIREKISISTSL
ncbi:MAG: 3-hydroxyacyl-CoA dehydrogenase NAD-binding domain-containing protein [Pseudomonadota bacterium]